MHAVSTVKFGFATLDDLPALMAFMDEHWRKGHILAKSERLWLHEFSQDGFLSVGIAKDNLGQLLGIFGYIPYNQNALPDIAGSLWMVTNAAQQQFPMLGIQLRDFVIKSVPHRFFAAPGAGLQTRPIYQVIRMNWHRMQQYFWLNPDITKPKLVKVAANFTQLPMPLADNTLSLQRITDHRQIADFDFAPFNCILPFKDARYVRHRFFEYPYFDYEVYAVSKNAAWTNLVVCRRAEAEGRTALRVVDFYGLETYLPDILNLLSELARKHQDEFVDFVCHGFDAQHFLKAGWTALDFDQEALVVPNFFEPFLLKNVPVYCVSDATDFPYRQCKADGDQDRPNTMS